MHRGHSEIGTDGGTTIIANRKPGSRPSARGSTEILRGLARPPPVVLHRLVRQTTGERHGLGETGQVRVS